MIRFFYGEDRFRLNEEVIKIKEDFFKKNTSNANLGVFDFEDKDYLSELKNSFKTQGLFSEKNLLFFKNPISSEKNKDKLAFFDFLENQILALDNNNLEVIFIENQKIKKNDKIFKWFLKNVKSEEFLPLDNLKLKEWIVKKFKEFNIEIENKLVENIVENNGNNLYLVSNEILKIANYIGDGKDNFNDGEIADLMNSKIEADIFQTIEYATSGNRKMAIRTLHNQIAKGDDPFYILSMYIYQFRNLLKIADFYFKGITNNFEIAKYSKMHPFVVQKSIQYLRSFELERLKKIYNKLEQADISSKSGKKEINLCLEILIIEMSK